MLQKEAKMNCF